MVSPQPSPVLKEAKDDQGVRLPNQVGSPHGGQAVEYKSEFPDNTLHLDHEEMVNIGVKVFEKAGLIESCDIEVEVLRNFLQAVRRRHPRNAYHSWCHAMHVMINSYNFIHPLIPLIPKCEVMGLLVTAVCHDLEHCGVGNAVLRQNKHQIAARFEVSPLESNSVVSALLILGGDVSSSPLPVSQVEPDEKKEGSCSNVLSGLDEKQAARVRLMLEDLILCTDIGSKEAMAKVRENFTMCCPTMDEWKAKQENAPNDEAAFEVRMGLYRKVLLAADIGIVCERAKVYAEWVKRLWDELFVNDNSMQPAKYYAGQVGFANGYAKPLFGDIAKAQIIPHFKQYVARLDDNVSLLQKHVDSEDNGHLVEKLQEQAV